VALKRGNQESWQASSDNTPEVNNPPSSWVTRFARYVPAGSRVLDLACGSGRHSRLFIEHGFRVLAVDRDLSGMGDLVDHPDIDAVQVDLEDGRPFPFKDERFGGVIVANYLYRPILGDIVSAVGEGGLLIYETFAKGNEPFDGPSRPDFLLDRGELLEAVRGELAVLAYEDLIIADPRPAAIQRIAAVREPVQS
jgi:SAM-dependent methyltransferase